MNSRACKAISRHSDVMLLEWLKTLVPESEHKKLNVNNLHQYLPDTNYFFVNREIRLSFYSPKWVRKGLKKLVKHGRELATITMADLEALAKSRQVSDEY